MKWEQRMRIKTLVMTLIGLSSVASADTLPEVRDVAPMTVGGRVISFTGEAQGGDVILYQTPRGGNTNRWVSIQTTPGEPAESVIQKLAEKIVETDAFGWNSDTPSTRAEDLISGRGLRLPLGQEGMFLISGDDDGLGIPDPPLFLTAIYDPEADEIRLKWENPPGGYDSIAVVWNGFGMGGLPGDSTSFVYDRKGRERPRGVEDLSICVVGYKNGIPSNAAATHLSKSAQRETIGLPFRKGVAPNWQAWSSATAGSSIEPRENRRSAKAKGKFFYQTLRCKNAEGVGGIYRKFIGLTPGHTYRISALMGNSKMIGDWSYSLHAAVLPVGTKALSTAQLAGDAALPDGSSGPTAAQIARFGPEHQSRDKFALATTKEDEGSPGRTIGDITLPDGADQIVVWVRCTCDSPDDSVGVYIDQLALEDLSFGAP